MYPTIDCIDDKERFLLFYPLFNDQRQHLLTGISVLVRPFVQVNICLNHHIMNILSYGRLPVDVNKRILEYTLIFIHKAGRFS